MSTTVEQVFAHKTRRWYYFNIATDAIYIFGLYEIVFFLHRDYNQY